MFILMMYLLKLNHARLGDKNKIFINKEHGNNGFNLHNIGICFEIFHL